MNDDRYFELTAELISRCRSSMDNIALVSEKILNSDFDFFEKKGIKCTQQGLVLTDNLNQTLEKFIDQVPAIVCMLITFMEFYKKLSMSEAVFFTHRFIDDQVSVFEELHPGKVQCKAACSSCCHMQVVISHGEAQILKNKYLENPNMVVSHERLENQSSWDFIPNKKPSGKWVGKDIPARRCFFLRDDEMCNIYSDRPTMCRSYRVVSEPKYCDPKKEAKVAFPNQLEIELAIYCLLYSQGTRPLAYFLK